VYINLVWFTAPFLTQYIWRHPKIGRLLLWGTLGDYYYKISLEIQLYGKKIHCFVSTPSTNLCQPGVNFINIFCAHFMYEILSPKPKRNKKSCQKVTFVRRMRAFTIDEIDARCQFHQHFTQNFFDDILLPISHKAKL
jgi:hypothetical protein